MPDDTPEQGGNGGNWCHNRIMRAKTQKDAHLATLGLTDAETAALTGVATVVDVPAGTVLYREGATGQQLAWILDGSADVIRSGNVIATVGAPDVLGEGTMLGAHETCSANVVADTPMTLAVLSRRDWQVAAHRAPSLVTSLFQVAVQRESATAA